MTENIWVAIIGFIKDIFVALIGHFKKKEKEPNKIPTQHFDATEQETEHNPFIPSEKDIERISIDDDDYLITIASYLSSDRTPDDVLVTIQDEG